MIDENKIHKLIQQTKIHPILNFNIFCWYKFITTKKLSNMHHFIPPPKKKREFFLGFLFNLSTVQAMGTLQ